MNWCVCYTTQYAQLISFLDATKSFQVDGRQFRVWAELLPPTEARPGGEHCEPPPDDPRTDFNETALMNQSFTGWSNGADITFAYWCGTFPQFMVHMFHRFTNREPCRRDVCLRQGLRWLG